MELLIGPSIGWLYGAGIKLVTEQEELISKTGANCLEIPLNGWDKEDERVVSLSEGTFGDFPYKSLHLPTIIDTMPNIAVALDIIDRYKINTTLTHPQKVGFDYPMAIYETMRRKQILLSVENMDKAKDSGFAINDLLWITDYCDLGFVLDVQHAYERDPSMIYASELFEALKDRLTHFHVSGETADNIHSLLYKATNADAIINFLGKVLKTNRAPLILEGEYSSSEELEREILFIIQELGL